MKITKELRLGFPLETEKVGTALVYSIPVRRDTFNLYYRELGAVFNECYGGDEQGIHLALIGPQIALSSLQNASRAMKTWDKPGGVEAGFVNELIRLTSVSYADPDGGGWKTLPLDTAREAGLIDDDERAEVLSALVFFTAACWVGPKPLVEAMLPVIGESLGWETGSFSSTEQIASWQKSIRDASTDAKAPETPETEGLSSIIA